MRVRGCGAPFRPAGLPSLDGPASSLPLYCAVLDAVIAGHDAGAERAGTILISGAGQDIDAVLASQHKLPSVSAAPTPIKRPLTTVR